VLVATHNLMHGLRLAELVERYRSLRDTIGLEILCVQENHTVDGRPHTARIAAGMGSDYREVSADDRNGVGVVYDGSRLALLDARWLPLPALQSLTWLERCYIAGGRPERRHALLAVFRREGGDPFALVTFHLETAGSNLHRRAQVAAIAAALESAGHERRAVVCGDTNAFEWRRRRQPAVMRELLAPLTERGLADVTGARGGAHRPTHFFARQHEPRLTHRLTVLAGKLGLDLPLRYDVVCSSLKATAYGILTTPESDHDLAWAALNAS
jgi:endonuclease/exonuclease/phosphatase family metal-dependent hydrolase